MNQIKHVQPEKRILVSKGEGAGFRRAMRAEQKSVAWMKYIVITFRKQRQVVVDP